MNSVRDRMTKKLTRDRVRLELRRARWPFVVLVVAAIAAIASLGYLLGQLRGGLPWSDRYEIRVAVDNATGVQPGKQEVRIAGVPVGQITGIELASGRPVLEISLEDRHAPLYRDARVRLRPRTPLNDLFLDVESRGHRRAGRLATGQTLQARRTHAPVEIGRVLNVFDTDTRPRVKEAIDELAVGLADDGDRLRATIVEIAPFLREAQQLSGELARRRGVTRRLVHNMRVLTEELGRREQQLAGLVRGGADTFEAVGAVDDRLAGTVAELPSTLAQLERSFDALRATSDRLDPALDALRPAADALPSGLAALRRLTRDALPAVSALRAPVRGLAPLLRHARPTAVDLDRSFAALLRQAPRLDRITARIKPCELAVQKFFHHTLSVLKFQTQRVAFPRGLVVGGLNSVGGIVKDPAQRAGRSCAPGGPGR